MCYTNWAISNKEGNSRTGGESLLNIPQLLVVFTYGLILTLKSFFVYSGPLGEGTHVTSSMGSLLP